MEACWFTPTEYNSMIKGIFKTLDLMKLSLSSLSSSSSHTSTTPTATNLFINSNSLSLSLYCMRGLENLFSGGDDQRDHQHQQQLGCLKKSIEIRRQNAIFAVLDEVDYQYERSSLIYDTIKIRDISMNYTRISKDIAHYMGRIDASSNNDARSDDVVVALSSVTDNDGNSTSNTKTKATTKISRSSSMMVTASSSPYYHDNNNFKNLIIRSKAA